MYMGLRRARETRAWTLALILCVAPLANASSLFESDEALDIELTGPLTSLFENTNNRDELPFFLKADGVGQEVRIRLRGKSRLQVCNFPPMRLNFEAAGSNETAFAGQSKLKLVTHCRFGDQGEQNLLEEYAAYRIFSLFSDAAYRVRLLRVTYADTDDQAGEYSGQRYGFVIETKAQLSERMGGDFLNVPGLALSQLNNEQAALVYVFEYLIGNTDWSLALADNDTDCCHNGDLIEVGQEMYIIPYDFDFSGLVNAPYAKPHPSLRLRSVRSRRYRGYCTDTVSLQKAIRKINSLEANVYRVVNDIPGMTENERKKANEYLEQFFKKARDEGKLLRTFEKSCLS